MTNRLVLGTAQIGMDYGIANKFGKMTREKAHRLLELAYAKGIGTLDTAYSYGDSEAIIGEFSRSTGKYFKVFSKLPNLAGRLRGTNNYITSDVRLHFGETLERLKAERLYGYYVHQFENLRLHNKLWHEIEELKNEGMFNKVGVSLYLPEELEYLLDHNVSMDIVQVPYNIFDRRFERYFPLLREKGIEVYARSVFLQGLFFLEIDRFEGSFRSAKEKMEELKSIAAKSEIPIYALCLGFALLNPLIDKIVIGVDSPEQLQQNIFSLSQTEKVAGVYDSLRSLEVYDEEIILPYKWK